MLRNSQYVIAAFGFAGTVLVVYCAALYFRLRRVRKKLSDLQEDK